MSKVSTYVQGFIESFETNPERFDIEYCYKDDDSTHIQLRDTELGYTKGSWIYIRDKVIGIHHAK